MAVDMNAKVLVVEDDEAIAAMLKYNLKADGFNAVHVDDGAEAVRAVEDERPDIILLDWMLPNVSGIEICRRLWSGGMEGRQRSPTNRARARRRTW